MDKSDVLKISQNLYGAIPALLDEMPMGFAVMRVLIDEDGEPFDFVYEYANKMFASLQNISLEDLRQYSWGQLFPDEEMQVLGAYANVALNGGSRVIEETEEDGERKLHINCYQPAYGYCALAVEEVSAAGSAVVQAAPAGAEENQMAQILAEEELQKMEQLAQQAAFMEPTAPQQEASEAKPEVPVPPLEPLQAAPQQEAAGEPPAASVPPLEPLQAVPQQEAAGEKPAAVAPPLEPLSAVPQQGASEEKPMASVPPLEPLQAVPQQEAAGGKPEAPVPPLEPLQAVPQQEAAGEKPAAVAPPLEPLQAAPQQETAEEKPAAPVPPSEPLAAASQQESVEEELVTGGVTVSHIVEENKPAGYATIADLMASANQNQYQSEPADEYAGEATPIGSIVNAYGGDSEGTWTEPGSSSDTVEFTEVEAVEEDTPVNIESFVSEEDTAAFVAVGEEAEIEVQQTAETEKPAEPVPELTADENSLMAKIKKVVESLNQFNEDKALEILTGLSNDSSLDASAVADVKKVKAMVECSMFEEAKELAQSLVAS